MEEAAVEMMFNLLLNVLSTNLMAETVLMQMTFKLLPRLL
jgi:hypothetical protein